MILLIYLNYLTNMSRKKKVIEPKIEEVKEEVKAPVEEPKNEFSVYNAESEFVRTYCVEIHGENAGELAKGFALKINGSIK